MKYELIHLNGFMYAVDDIPDKPYIGPYIICWPSSKKELFNSHNAIAYSRRNISYMVIASNDPSLGLPLLPAVEEDVERLAYKSANKLLSEFIHPKDVKKISQLWIDGYKAASAKQFTEEDMRKAIELSREDYVKDVIDIRHPIEIIQSLKPKPIAVELEMTRKCALNKSDCFGFQEMLPDCGCQWIPAVDENNYVKVKQWYYE